ncbi:putative transcriptional regulator LovE [Madurella mycetomatis]|uniref:Transcriptional regulator LovE n=1 Tax=Madurella mycetomatis TaxID=100816 RepID=A0A175VWQ6_9PEZI|nr:putative transcriptional regulator LovE [Madurella mycetomatis]
MTPATNTTTATPRRQSCDRCHGQKLRCTRPDNARTGACDRCLRKGAQCAYSSSLPKGRPSLYRLSEASVGSKGSGKSSSASPTPPVTTPSTAETTTVPPALPITPITPAQQGPKTAAGDGDADQDGDIGMDLQSGTFVWPGPIDAFADFWGSWWPEDTNHHILDSMPVMTPGSTFNLDPALEAETLINLEFPTPFHGSSENVSAEANKSAIKGPTRQDGVAPDKNLGERINRTSNGDTSGPFVFTADKNGVDLSIAHLSRLSTRLSQLLGSSRRFLAEALDPSDKSSTKDPVLQVQLGIEAVFKSINTWLVHGSTNCDSAAFSLEPAPADGFDLLHHVFSASNHLLEILRHIRVSVVANASGPSTPAFPSPPGSNLSVETTTTTSTSSADGGHPSTSVVHHLVLVCVTLLLNMYLAILIALQRSADTINSSLRERAVTFGGPNDHMDAPSRVHLQLVSVVQLCSYFIKRQNQILVMSNQGPPRENERRQAVTVPSDAIADLMAEVEQRLIRLQESLYMPTS